MEQHLIHSLICIYMLIILMLNDSKTSIFLTLVLTFIKFHEKLYSSP